MPAGRAGQTGGITKDTQGIPTPVWPAGQAAAQLGMTVTCHSLLPDIGSLLVLKLMLFLRDLVLTSSIDEITTLGSRSR